MVTTTVPIATVTRVDNGDGKMEKVKMKVGDGFHDSDCVGDEVDSGNELITVTLLTVC